MSPTATVLPSDLVYHITGLINIFIIIVLASICVLRIREVNNKEAKVIDSAYILVSISYIIFLGLSQVHFWSTRTDLGNTLSKVLLTLFVTITCIDLILRHKRGEC